MKLLEYEAKSLLNSAGIPVPASVVISKQYGPEITLPVVFKSQVPTGGRGKLGGIIIVEDSSVVTPTIDALFALKIKGFLPTHLLAEEKLAIASEFYLCVMIDQPSCQIRLVAHRNGGVEVEDNEASSFLHISLSKDNSEATGQQLAEYYDLPGQTFALQDMTERLYDCFVKNDATLIEINPLVLTDDKRLVAGDCKMELDDSARYRHDWTFEDKPIDANFVTLNQLGDVATIANGAGLAMATVDAATDHGLNVANFLDIGGGANTESLLIAFRRIGDYPNVKAIVINIFAGITRCDEVAKAIIAAKQQIADLPPLCIRLAGTNFEAASELLQKEGITILGTLEECLIAAKKEVTS